MEFFLQIIANSLVLGTQVLFLALSLYLIKAVSKIEHVALGAIATACGYGFYQGLLIGSNVMALLFSLVVAFTLGYISFLLLEKFYKNKEPLLGLIVSLSMGLLIEAMIAIVFKSSSKSLIEGILPIVDVIGVKFTLPGVYTLAIGFVLALAAFILVNKTPIGRTLRSVSENSSLVSSLGINQLKIRKSVYIISSVIAGIVGVLAAMNTSLTPNMGFNLTITAFIVLFVGGSSDIKGTIVASFLLSLIPEFLINYAPSSFEFTNSYRMFFVFALALIILSFKPRGIFSKNIRQS